MDHLTFRPQGHWTGSGAQWVPGTIFPEVKRPRRDAASSIYVVPKLRLIGAITPLGHAPSWRAQTQLFLYLWSSKVPYHVKIPANWPYPEQLYCSQLRSPFLKFTITYDLFFPPTQFSPKWLLPWNSSTEVCSAPPFPGIVCAQFIPVSV
jgi:hypothetical protein